MTNIKITVDGRIQRPIMRPTSGADLTENSLQINELSSLKGVGSFAFRSEGGARLELTAIQVAVEFASRYRAGVCFGR